MTLTTAGELATEHADKMRFAQTDIATVMQAISEARLDIDRVSDIELVNLCNRVMVLGKLLDLETRLYKRYSALDPNSTDFPRAPF